jgi:rod shape determining protein RodA
MTSYDLTGRGLPRGPAKLLALNWSLILLLCAVACTGFLMLYSVAGGSLEPWAEAQMIRFAAGLVIMVTIGMIDIRFWRLLSAPAYIVSFVLLVAVDVMGYYAWLDPAKVSRPFWVLLPVMLILMPVALVMEQPDLGTAILLLAGGGAVMFLSGVSLWYFGAAIAAGVGLVATVLKSKGTDWQLIEDYQFRRIFTFLDPSQDPLGAGYHITQAKIAMGSGGLVGRGYMQGTQSRLNFLPEKHTDFIVTTLAEEFGFVGTATLLVLYTLVIVFCISSAISNRDRFGALLTGGIATTFFLLFAVNMGMVMGLMPVVGVPLPLVSYGGSAMLVLLAAFGLVQSAHVHRPRNRD